MPITSYGDISPRVGIALDAKALAHAQPVLVFQKFAQQRPIPANKGQTIKFRRYNPFALATTALTEGVRPSSQSLTVSDVTFTLSQYGAFTQITDKIQDTHEDPILSQITILSGEQAGETVEKVLIGNISGGLNAVFANGTQRNQVNTKFTLNVQRKATRALKNNRARKITKMSNGSVNVGTRPIEASYICICHTDLENDIRGVTGFIPVAQYGSMTPTCPEEIGAIEDVRYILSQNVTAFANAGAAAGGTVVSTGGTLADVYPMFFFGDEAFGVTSLKGQDAINMMVLKPGEPRFGDELGQVGSVGWKTYHASGLLNGAWLVRAEVAATAL
jgi:N4-gp56 family major capsid protein